MSTPQYPGNSMPKVADIIRIIETMAPRRLAEDWDNIGLHYGDPDWPVSKVFVCLDPTLRAMEAAVDAGADLVVSHHPLIFKPVTHIRPREAVGSVIDCAARHRIGVYCAHTNLDAAKGGVNDVLAEKIGLETTGPLAPAAGEQRFKIVVFAPSGDVERIYDAVSHTSAGRIGDYTGCAFLSEGTGRFVPGANSVPRTGTPGQLSSAGEVRIEMPVSGTDIDEVIRRIRTAHSYETVPCDVYPLHRETGREGLGRIGRFASPRSLEQTARDIKAALGLKMVKTAGPASLEVGTAALCSGGGGGLVGAFLSSGAQVYISGDLNHHSAVDIAAAGRGLIDIGHFASERIVVPVLSRIIGEQAKRMTPPVAVIFWEEEADPFVFF